MIQLWSKPEEEIGLRNGRHRLVFFQRSVINFELLVAPLETFRLNKDSFFRRTVD